MTDLVRISDQNVFAVEVAEGWYAGRLGVRGGTRFWYDGKEIAMLAQLEVRLVTTSRPTTWTLNSDSTWLCGPSAILRSEIYDGETYDMREEDPDWKRRDLPADRAQSFGPTEMIPWPSAQLVLSEAPPVRLVEQIYAKLSFVTPSGKLIIDFGQNLVGAVRIHSLAMPAAGDKVTLRHAEVMEHGELGVRPLRSAKCTDVIISDGTTLRDWSPQFTFHGFRYLEVEGYSGPSRPRLENFTALVMHSDMERRGYFTCSNALVNKLHENVVWGMKGNFFSI